MEASTETRPIRLSPHRSSTLSIDLVNPGPAEVTVKIVRLEGRVAGLTFFAYDTNVGLTVPSGSTGSRRFELDLGGLDGQATGLIPGKVKLLDPDRREVASVAGVIDVRGSLWSVYGLFGLGVAIVTTVAFAGCLIGLARHLLPVNRWRRALRFLTPGLGLGLVVNFTLSATRVFVPAVGRWLTIMVLSGLVFFGAGYLTPTPDAGDADEEAEEEAASLAAAEARAALEAGRAQPRAALAGSEASASLAPPPALGPPDADVGLPPGDGA